MAIEPARDYPTDLNSARLPIPPPLRAWTNPVKIIVSV